LKKDFFAGIALLACALVALAQTGQGPYEPIPYQPGKDVVWVPTPFPLVDKMLDMARVTPKDYVVDLGSGDGRNVIAAAKRGAHALGVEYDPDLVALSQRNAGAEGVSGKAQFIKGDMFEADISRASVLALFLLPDNLRRLTPRFAALAPGTRIVTNSYPIPGWDAEETQQSGGDCGSWCTAYLYIVPANVTGKWRLPKGEVTFEQDFQSLSGALSSGDASMPLSNGRVKGDRISFAIGLDEYKGRVRGDTMSGEVSGSVSGRWTASRVYP
jgi:SAM-dependent methyltransferase